MKTLAEAIYGKLVSLYTATKVFHGIATAEATMPYQVFSIGQSEPIQLNTANHKYSMKTVPFTVHVFGVDDAIVADRLEDIWDSFDAGLTVGRHECISVMHTADMMEIDPDLSTPGSPVWHGFVMFEARLCMNELESSSSSSSSSSTSSSSSSSTHSASSASSSSSTTLSSGSSSSTTLSSSSTTLSSASSPSTASSSSSSTVNVSSSSSSTHSASSESSSTSSTSSYSSVSESSSSHSL